MASSLRQPQSRDCRVDDSRKVQVTILASEWGSSKGGLSTINRELAIQLARCPEVEITFFLPQCSQEDKKLALRHNVKIVEATPLSGFEQLDWLCFPPEDLQVDIIVGHGVKLGKQAQIIKRSKRCKWVQVVHTDPEELGMFKNYPDPISKGEEKHKIEVELCEMADHVVGIGPKLSEAFRSYLRGCQKDDNVVDFTPGVFEDFAAVKQAPSERQQRSVLVFGRGDVEDFELKGFDIAGKAVAALQDTRLVFVGAPNGKHKEIAERLSGCGVPASRLRVRGFVQDRESLRRLFQEVDLVVMPSRTEGFGLTGLEALSAGLPVLVSRNSGFGEALCCAPFGSSYVVDTDEPAEWTSAIKKLWAKDRKSRLEEAEVLRYSYGGKYNWAKQINDLVDKMISWVQDDSSNSQSSLETEGRNVHSTREASKRTKGLTGDHEVRSIFPCLQKLQRDADQVSNKTSLPSDLEEIAANKGFVVTDNQASGNCLFYALSGQLQIVKGIKISHKELRNSLVQFLAENAKLQDGTPLLNFVSGYSTWRDYLQSMAKDGTWGDHLVLLAAANYFQSPIRIISSLDREIVVQPDNAVADTHPLVLGHIHEFHYVSLQPKQVDCSIQREKRSIEEDIVEDVKTRAKIRKILEDFTIDSRCTVADLSYLADVVEKIRQLYRTREQRLLPVPWLEEFSFHLNDIFTRLKVVGKEKTRGVFTDDITDMTAIFKPIKEMENGEWKEKKPRTVLIEGDPGMGKTTYCQKLAYDWATKQDKWDPSFPEIEVLLLLKCYEIKSDIWEAIDDQILPEEMDDQAKECFFKFIRENQSKVLLVLDGLDEADPSNLKLFLNLVESKELSNCYIVLTSRHEAGGKVKRFCDNLWEIVGFTQEDAESYIHKYFKNINKEHLARKLMQMVGPRRQLVESREAKDLRELTKNPLNTALLCIICEDFEGVFPTSRTHLYIEIVLCVLRRYERKQGLSSENQDLLTVYKEDLLYLGGMALKSLIKGELYFEQDKSGGRLSVLSKFGFLSLQASGSKRKVSVRYAFLHKSFQEFFSGFCLAWKLIEGVLDCESVVTNQRIENELYQVFLFTIGILASTCKKTAKFVVKSMAKSINFTLLQSKRFSFALGCLSGYASLLHTLGKHLNFTHLNMRDSSIGDSGAASLSQVLETNSSLISLDLSFSGIGDSGASSLSKALAVNSSVTSLDLSFNSIGDSGAESLSKILTANSSLTDLNLSTNNIKASGAASLSQALAVNSSLTYLDLSANFIGDDGVASLSQALALNSFLTDLNLSTNGICSVVSLSQVLAGNLSLTYLDLSQNIIGDYGASYLSQGLAANSSLTSLNLSSNIIGNPGAASFSNALAVNSSLTNLDLRWNSISDSGAGALSSVCMENKSVKVQLDDE